MADYSSSESEVENDLNLDYLDYIYFNTERIFPRKIQIYCL